MTSAPSTSLAQCVALHASEQPEALALLTPARAWRYGELADEAGAAGARLRRAGFGPGSIAALAGPAPALARAAVACSAAGAGFLPLDPATAEGRWPALQALGGAALARLRPDGEGESGVAAAEDEEPPALVIATSGSEGTPKAVMLSAANLAAAAAASNERLPLAPGDLWLACLPLHHIGGMSILHRCALAGATVLLHEGFDAAAVWRELRTQAVTHLSLVPAMLARLLEAADGPPPATLRYALIGGAALSRPLFERAVAAGWPLCPTYGMSECAAQMATLVTPAAGAWSEGLVGTPLSGFQVDIGADGRIRLRGAQVMLGYLNPGLRPGLGLEEGWFVSSDLGRLDGEGRLTVLGRADELFVTGGVNVHPLEVESCLAACPGVADVAVTAVPDPVWGDLLVALVVGSAAPERVRDWGRERLAPAQRPRRVLAVPCLPRNAMGKLERAALRALVGGTA